MPSRPWYPLNPSDYIADTAFLSLEGHGVYFLMINYLWIHDNELPESYDQLSRLLRADVRRIKRLMSTELKDYFVIDKGVISNKRVGEELAKATEKIEKLRKAGRKGGKANAKANAQADATPNDEANGEASNNQTQQPYKNNSPKTKFSDEDMKFSRWMFDLILKDSPKTKKPKFEKWAEVIRKCREIDKRTHKELAEVFKWANEDEFWTNNILSPTKLREHFDKLQRKVSKPKQKGGYIINGERVVVPELHTPELLKFCKEYKISTLGLDDKQLKQRIKEKMERLSA